MSLLCLAHILRIAAGTIEREVVCNDDFDGNEDVLEAIEDIRQAADELRKFTGADSREKSKREEHERLIADVLRMGNNNKEFQYFFAYTCNADDDIHCMGCSDFVFDVNTGTELMKRAARHVKNTEEIINAIRFAILEDDDDD